MIKHTGIIILIAFLTSCNSIVEDVEYYSNTDIIKSKKIYNSIEDKKLGNYVYFEYDSIGLKKTVLNYKKNKLNGNAYFYYPNGNIKSSTRYLNDKEFGVIKVYTEKGNLNKELLCINDRDVIIKVFMKYSEIKSFGFRIFPLFNDTINEYDYEGRIIYDTNMNIIDSVTFYYDIQKKEKFGDDHILKVKLLGEAFRNFSTNINLFLGELDLNDFSNGKYSLRDTIGIVKSNKNELEFNYDQFNFENGLVTGLLQLELYSNDCKEKIRDKYFIFYYDLSSIR